MSGSARSGSHLPSMDAVRIDELDTPCLTVSLAVFESNLRLCTDRLVGVRVRPHFDDREEPGGGTAASERG